ncbi:MAG: hypothetical protein ACI91B_003734 [Planctomycetota bacterium]|jgi:hypothetical protein
MHYSVLLALPLFVGTALAQTPVFPNAAPRATPLLIAGSDVGAPSLRYWGASATNGTSLLNFGGRSVNTNGSAGPTYYNGLDGFNPTTNTWTNLSPDGATGAPSNRHRPAMAFDPTANRLVVFGGATGPAGPYLGDCFAFDLGTNAWSTIPNPTPGTTGPSARTDSKMAFDASTGVLVLFGGMGPGGPVARLNDTWLLAGTTWIPMTPTTSPSARSSFAMTARSAPYNDIVMFGGRNTNNAISAQTWCWDGTASNWAQITPVNGTTPATWGGGTDAIYDSVRKVVTIINGNGTGIAPSTTGLGSWISEYDCVNNKWRAFGNITGQSLPGPLIGQQNRFAIAFLNGKTYFWGGRDPSTTSTANLAFVKEYQANPLATAVAYGTGCAGQSGNLLTLTPDNEPWTGRTWSGTCSNLGSSSIALSVFGFASVALPLNVVAPGPGQPGCWLLTSSDLIVVAARGAGTAAITLAVPYNVALAGQQLHTQMGELSFAPTKLWTSNGLTITIGAL